MADTTPAEGTPGPVAAAPGSVFQLQRVYLKDASLELPHAPHIFLEQEAPQVDVQLEVSQRRCSTALHEVVVRVTATAKVKDKVLFLVEAKQAGIFEMRGIPNEQMDAILGVVCPGIVYPYLRANVADLIIAHRSAADPPGGDQLRGVLLSRRWLRCSSSPPAGGGAPRSRQRRGRRVDRAAMNDRGARRRRVGHCDRGRVGRAAFASCCTRATRRRRTRSRAARATRATCRRVELPGIASGH